MKYIVFLILFNMGLIVGSKLPPGFFRPWYETNLFVILDDESYMAHLKHRLVKTDSYDGLGFRKALEVTKMLGVRE